MKVLVGKLFFAVLVALMVCNAFSCGKAGNKTPRNEKTEIKNTVSEKGFSVTISIKPSSIKKNGILTLCLQVRNNNNSIKSFTLENAQIYDFVARDSSGNNVWQWSKGRAFAMVAQPICFEPKEKKIYTDYWSPGGFPSGVYRIEGYFLGLKALKPAVKVRIQE
ncbi:MAG: BsuPI-related putative proteinase inhibitor [Actinomycetota bacterium]|nr:BsuPI-related putative proteinase inhibitor [Actinomycetota bacterium]